MEASNPNIPDDEEEGGILKRLRGDAIGSTLYSERFVISTLLKLQEMKETLENDQQFEKELESLWDMTIEEDVILLLIELGVYEIFTQSIITYEKDSRLVEILVGIMGNMCTVSKAALDELCETDASIEVLLQLISCGDSGVLIQLMRLMTMVYVSFESALIWNKKIMAYTEFIEHFCFILNNSTNQILLGHALETLNATLAQCAALEQSNGDSNKSPSAENNTTILEKLITSSLVESTIEAFQTFFKKETEEHDDNNTNTEHNDAFDKETNMSEALKKTFLSFLYINDIFVECRPEAYNDDSKANVRTCFNLIIKTFTTADFVSPENIDYLHEMLASLLQIYTASDTLHNEETSHYIIKLWDLIRTIIVEKRETTTNDFESEDLELNEGFKELRNLNEKLLKLLLKSYDAKTLTKIIGRSTSDFSHKIFQLCGLDIKNYNHNHIEIYCDELEKILNADN